MAVIGVDGAPLGTLDLQAAVGEQAGIDAVGAAGDRIGIAYSSSEGHRIDTVRVDVGAGSLQE